MDELDQPKALQAAVAAVAGASVVCRHVFAGMQRIVTLTKDDRSPVTVADFASQAVVVQALHRRLGPITMVAEETSEMLRDPAHAATLAAVVDAVRIAWPDAREDEVLEAIDAGAARDVSGGYWTLDPIDGTKGFLRGGQYAVSLARVGGGEPVLGVLGCPNLSLATGRAFDVADAVGSVYWAARGAGAHAAPLNDLDQVRPVRHEPEEPRDFRVAESVERGHSKREHTEKVLDGIERPRTVVRLDSQAKYAVVARGEAHAYLRMPTRRDYRECVWDHAAGHVVATEAGCVVTDIGGRKLDFSQPPKLRDNLGIVCATEAFHGPLIERIAALGLAEGEV